MADRLADLDIDAILGRVPLPLGRPVADVTRRRSPAADTTPQSTAPQGTRPTPAVPASKPEQPRLPPRARRSNIGTIRVGVELPRRFALDRDLARKARMSATLLVVSALQAAAASLTERAQTESLEPIALDGVIKLDLLLSEAELSQLDDLAAALRPALGLARPSRSAAVALLLDEAGKPPPTR